MAAVDVAVLDMTGAVDAFPLGIPANSAFAKGGVVVMGRAPDGRAAPSWWKPSNNPKSIFPWNCINDWWFINRSTNLNQNNNVRIQVRNKRIQIQRTSTGAWTTLGNTSDPGAEYYPPAGSGAPTGNVAKRAATNPGGGVEFKFDSNVANTNIHGYGSGFVDISAYIGDIKDIFSSIEARLVLDDPMGTDDRADAKYLMDAGCDFYPGTDWRVDAGAPANKKFAPGEYYNPGCGAGRFKFLTNEWQLFTWSPLANALEVDGSPELSAASRTISEADFRAQPPVFSLDDGATPTAYTLTFPTAARAGAVVRARVTDQNGAAVSGATLSWDGGANGGTIYGTTNAAGVAAVRLGGPGSFALRATSGALTSVATIVVQYTDAAINASQYPEDITNAVWELEGSGNTKTGNNVSDVYGTTTWDTYTQGTGDPALNQRYTGLAASGRYTLSRFIKKGSTDWVSLRLYAGEVAETRAATVWFNVNTGAVGSTQSFGAVSNIASSIENWGAGIYRVSLSLDAATTGGIMVSQMRICDSDYDFTFTNGATIGVGADQMQAGALTAYEPTSTAPVIVPVVQAKQLRTAVRGEPYSETITCVGSEPITWTIDSGTLPAGLTTNASGNTSKTLIISGTVSAATGETFVIKATNSGGNDTESFTLNVAALDAPNAPTLTTLNSDTFEVGVTGIDADATHVDLYAQQTAPVAGDYALVGRYPKADFPVDVTDLVVAATYKFKAQAATELTVSADSAESSTATLHRLFAYLHLEPVSGGATGVRVAAGRNPSSGIFPTELYGFSDTEAIDVATVTWNSEEHSRITLQLSEQPASAKIRNGDSCCMYAFKEVTPGVELLSTYVVYNGVVVEGP